MILFDCLDVMDLAVWFAKMKLFTSMFYKESINTLDGKVQVIAIAREIVKNTH